MRFVIVTGMSGAGKSTALKMLEDMGYFCVDNLPIPLLPRFVEMFGEPEEEVKKVALGIDVRGGQDFPGLKEALDDMDERGIEYDPLSGRERRCAYQALQRDKTPASVERIRESGYGDRQRTRKDHVLKDEGNLYNGYEQAAHKRIKA